MVLSTSTTQLPLRQDAHGVIRVGGTRVTLETVLIAFKNGATCEEIVFQFPALELADVYAVIGYYLRNQAEIEDYLKKRQQNAERIRKKIEAHFDPQGIRERLLKRQIENSNPTAAPSRSGAVKPPPRSGADNPGKSRG